MAKVPAIPPTAAVKDTETRRVLDSIVHVLNIRSGNGGSGDNVWLDKAALLAVLQDEDVVKTIRAIVSR